MLWVVLHAVCLHAVGGGGAGWRLSVHELGMGGWGVLWCGKEWLPVSCLNGELFEW